MITQTKHTRQIILIVILFYMIVSLINLGSWGVIESSEARYAEISREMFLSKDWVHPTLLGIHHYHKPPATYLLTTIGYKIFGVNSFGARVLLVVSYAVQIFLVYWITLLILEDEKISLYGAIIYSSFPIVLISVRGLTADAYLNTFVLASIASWLNWRASSKLVWLYIVPVLLGLAFLTKGPIALLIPVAVFWGLRDSLPYSRTAFTLHHLTALLVFLIIAGSWFAILIREDKLFVDYFLFRHTIDRFTNANVFSRTEPWWYYVAYAPLLALPWTIILFYWMRSVKKNQIPPTIKRTAIFWILIPLAFFSLSSSKLVLYVLPVFAGIAMVCGWCIRVMPSGSLKSLEFLLFVWAILICVSLLLLCYILHYEFSAELLILSLIYLLTLISTKIRASFGDLQRVLLYSISLSSYLILFSSLFIPLNALRFNSTEPIANWIRQNGLVDHQIIVYDQLLPSLAFALGKDVISVNNGNRNLNREVQFEKSDGWKHLLINLNDRNRIVLDSLLAKPSIIISKGTLYNSSLLSNRSLSKKKEFGNWVLYCTR